MQFILIAGVSLISYFVVKKLCKITKMECQILYLIIGIGIGFALKLFNMDSVDQLFPKIGQYNTIALLFVFFVSGFSINISQLIQSGPVTAKLFSIPSYVETFVMMFLIAWLTPLGYLESLIVAAIFASASPANMISICAKMIQTKNTGKNNLPSTMIMACIVDSFITIPIVFAGIFILMSQGAGWLKIVGIVLLILLGIVLALLTGIVLGRMELLFVHHLFKKIHKPDNSQNIKYILILIAFFLALLISFLLQSVDAIQKAVTLFGILIMFGIGISMNRYDKTGVNKMIARNGNSLFAMFGMPSIFMYVGSIIDLKVLLNIRFLILLIAITCIAVIVKRMATKFVLKDPRYSKAEREFAANCFIPKGVALINFSVIFGAILGNDHSIVSFMRMLATIGILITMTYGIPKIQKTNLNKEI